MSPSRPNAARPIRMRVLGGADLRRDGSELTRVLAQPRRFAVLVRLALAPRGSFVRRDRLLGMFWADSEETRARAALRQAVRYLRRWLGDGVLVGRGDGELGVDPARLTCDVVELRDHLDRGEDREAVELYRGPLLPGFLVSDARGFEQWLAGERRRLRAAAVDAAVRLATAAEETGELEEAAELTRTALRIDPVNETVARRRIALLDELGNRAGAVATYEAFAARLRKEFDLEPAPETEGLMETVRDRSRPRSGREAARGGRRPGRRRVVVTRFENRTGLDELDVLGGMAADWIAQGLATLPDVDVVPPLLGPEPASPAVGAPDPRTDPDGRSTSARPAGVDVLVEGACYLEEDELRFRTRITDTVENRLIPAPDDVVASRERPMEGLEELGRRVCTRLAPLLNPRGGHVREATRPPSFDAYLAYMEGLELFIRGRWEAALTRFRHASDLEPGYALPRLVGAISHWNLGELPEADAAAREAARLRHRLGRFEGALLEAVRAWLSGDWVTAHRAARIQAEIAPGSIAHFQVAEEARRLNRPREARSVLAGLDPEQGELEGWIFYWIEATTAHHLLDDHGRELERARRARSLHPGDPVATLLEVRALAALGAVDTLLEVLDGAAALPGDRMPRTGDLLREAGLELAAHGWPEPAAELLARAARWYEERVEEASSVRLRRDLARSLYHAGRWEEAEGIFVELAGDDPPAVAPVGFHHGHLQAHLDHGYLAVIAAHRGDETAVEGWRRMLEDAGQPYLYGAPRLWLAALDAVLGDRDRATSHLRRAFAEGLPYETSLHADPHLSRLRGHAGFESLMRPRG